MVRCLEGRRFFRGEKGAEDEGRKSLGKGEKGRTGRKKQMGRNGKVSEDALGLEILVFFEKGHLPWLSSTEPRSRDQKAIE